MRLLSRLLVGSLSVQLLLGASVARADSYDNVWMETYYITQCSFTAANPNVGNISTGSPGYGALNDWRIGTSRSADAVDPGTSAIGAIGLLYGYQRLLAAGRSNPDLDARAKTALSGYFWSWVRNPQNHVVETVNGTTRVGFMQSPTGQFVNYDAHGNRTNSFPAGAAATAEVLIAMRKYCLYSPNGDRANYQTQEYALAHQMADYINAHLGSWTIDRSYAVAAFRAFSHWATAVGDTATANYYNAQANTVAGWLANAQDKGSWGNYYAYLDGGGNGVYNGGIDQTGFSPYEFSARDPGEAYAKKLADWWETGTAYNGVPLSIASGRYAGGVHQWTPQNGTDTKVYPGSALQLADAEWKIARATGNYHDLYGAAWKHYNFALSALGSANGSGCWVNNTSVDGVVGGFVDWVDTANGARPAAWQRFVDTSAYLIIATEQLAFSNLVDWSH
ncbi:hypothetical protein [Melittangium boletus]|uniref:Uncharacterized protein n=1 Tax=Melittangium boletus DSM 14713 TaxID=1294270 RepID=A0A250IEP1_9BACT|nr:hypothetical protein [Melittangium boletus]ATB29611.1 hypothetical protein MEBOL_003066 [Melittangium boletus DSM 14713]